MRCKKLYGLVLPVPFSAFSLRGVYYCISYLASVSFHKTAHVSFRLILLVYLFGQ